MPSAALISLRAALDEVTDLGRMVRPTSVQPTAALLRFARVAGRAQVVLLSSHFERYFYAVNEEAVAFLNGQGIIASALPEGLKLLHSRYPIEEMAETGWEHRSKKLADFVSGDAWLWSTGHAGTLSHERLLAWLVAPKPVDLRRYYRYWGIEDIFAAITRSRSSRGKLWLGIQELVDKRNNIAHGDFAAQATQIDIRRYVESVSAFCVRADRLLARVLGRLIAGAAPW